MQKMPFVMPKVKILGPWKTDRFNQYVYITLNRCRAASGRTNERDWIATKPSNNSAGAERRIKRYESSQPER